MQIFIYSRKSPIYIENMNIDCGMSEETLKT